MHKKSLDYFRVSVFSGGKERGAADFVAMVN